MGSNSPTSINYEAGRVRVVYSDRNDAVTDELPLQSFEYDMPHVGDPVYVMHQSNGVAEGVVLSRYFHDNNMPIEYGPHIHRKEYGPDAFMRYDRDKEILTLNFKKIVITGDVLIRGDLKIKGRLEVEDIVRLEKEFQVDGDALFLKNTQVDGDSLVSGGFEVMGDMLANGDVTAKNNLTVDRNIDTGRNINAVGFITPGDQNVPDIEYIPPEKELVPRTIEEIEDIE